MLQKIRAKFGRVIIGVSYVSMVLLFAMVVIVAVDVILRKAQIGRINGSNELTTYFMVVVCLLGIPVLQLKYGHVWVNLVTNKFPYRFRTFWLFVTMIIETAVIALIAIGAYDKVALFVKMGTTTDVLDIPKWIFAIFGLIAFVEYFILSLIDTIQLCVDGVKNEQPAPAAGGWSDDEVKGI